MGCRGRCLFASLVALGVLGLAAPASADSIMPPYSYKQVAPGGRFVFVMISPASVEDEAKRWVEAKAADIREVRRAYTKSGLYRNDGSAEPLWTVDWYAYGVHLTPDGVYLIRPGRWAGLQGDRAPDLGCVAVSFYARGELIREYRVGELVDAPGRLPRSVSHYRWQEEGRVSGEFGYEITTLDGNRFVFDVRTGEVVSASRRGRIPRWGWLAVGGCVGAAGVWCIWRRSRRRRGRTAPSPTSAPNGPGEPPPATP